MHDLSLLHTDIFFNIEERVIQAKDMHYSQMNLSLDLSYSDCIKICRYLVEDKVVNNFQVSMQLNCIDMIPVTFNF